MRMFEKCSITILLIFSYIFGYCTSFGLKSSCGLSGRVRGPYYHQRNFLLQDQADGDNAKFKSTNKADDNDIRPPPPPTGNGEWADWDTDGYIEEPYEGEDGDGDDDKVPSFAEFGALIAKSTSIVDDDDKRIPSYEEELQLRKDAAAAKLTIVPSSSGQWSPLSSGKKGEPMGMSASDNWAGWSEDAPYFDEDDSQDDEGNWGRSEGSDKPGYGAVSGSSDLWTRQTPVVEVPSAAPVQQKSVTAAADIQPQHAAISAATISSALPATASIITDSSSSSSSGSSSSGNADTLTVVLEMNRQFSNLDMKMTLAETNNERRIGNLMSEIKSLKAIIAFLIGTVVAVISKLLWNV